MTITFNPMLMWMLVNLWTSLIVLMNHDAKLYGSEGLWRLFAASVATPLILRLFDWGDEGDE
jgi:hypothetical protein